jgi:hypothetical protein
VCERAYARGVDVTVSHAGLCVVCVLSPCHVSMPTTMVSALTSIATADTPRGFLQLLDTHQVRAVVLLLTLLMTWCVHSLRCCSLCRS